MKQKRVRLTPQRTKLVTARAQGKSMSEAARIAGYSSVQSASNAFRAMRVKMPEIMDKHGLTDDALIVNYLLPLMNAKKKKFFSHIVLDEREVDDNATQLAALDMALKLKGSYPKKEDEPTGSSSEFKLTITHIGNGPGSGPDGAYRPPPGVESNEVERAQLPNGSEVLDVKPKADDPAPVEEPNPVVPPTNQVVPPTVPVSPKTQVAGFVRLGRPRGFWNPGRR